MWWHVHADDSVAGRLDLRSARVRQQLGGMQEKQADKTADSAQGAAKDAQGGAGNLVRPCLLAHAHCNCERVPAAGNAVSTRAPLCLLRPAPRGACSNERHGMGECMHTGTSLYAQAASPRNCSVPCRLTAPRKQSTTLLTRSRMPPRTSKHSSGSEGGDSCTACSSSFREDMPCMCAANVAAVVLIAPCNREEAGLVVGHQRRLMA